MSGKKNRKPRFKSRKDWAEEAIEKVKPEFALEKLGNHIYATDADGVRSNIFRTTTDTIILYLYDKGHTFVAQSLRNREECLPPLPKKPKPPQKGVKKEEKTPPTIAAIPGEELEGGGPNSSLERMIPKPIQRMNMRLSRMLTSRI